ncbi:hypothetical protein ACFOKF_12870 [Sphingobium rhizovicinum]|uniref:Uncharacterized protein n=1 Tax=Sphingobium rhizovicinum TaxID=432308 RepID=A0ABV7NHV5_9SPHN
MADGHWRRDVGSWLEESSATGPTDFDLAIDQALERVELRLPLARMRADDDENESVPDRRPPDHPTRSRLLWTGGIGLLALGAMAWAMIAALPLLAARAEYFAQAGAAALARSVSPEPAPQRWPE